MKKTLLSILAICSITLSTNAQLLDQSNSGSVSSGWLVNNGSYTSVGQSFTAGVSGEINDIRISLDNNNGVYPLIAGDFTITVKDGDGYGGATIGNETFSITGTEPYGDFTIPFSPGAVNITAGNTYTYIIEETSGTGQIMLNASSNNYPGGILYSQVFTNPASPDANRDFLFKVFVSPSQCISDQTVLAGQQTICAGDSTVVSTNGSDAGVYYFLRDTSNNTFIGDAITGTGSALDFNTSSLNDTTGFEVFAVDSNTTINNALNFSGNGSLDNVDLGTNINSILEGTNAFTVEAWVNASSGSGLHNIIGSYDNSEMQFLLRIINGIPEFYISDGSSFTNILATTNVVGTWTHLTGTWDGTTMKIYVNGVEEGSVSKTGNFPACLNSTTIAGGLSNNTEYFVGDIAQVKIWNTARTAQEINDNMTNCVTTPHSNLIAAYNMVDGTGSTLTDDSGNGIDGVLLGNSQWTNPSLPYSCYCEKVLNQPVTVNVNQPSTGVDTQTACESYTWIDGITYTSSNNTAKDTLINAVGCDSIVTLNLTINLVNLSVTNNNNTLMSDANGASYQWVDCDDNFAPITGETNQSFTPASNGSYAVIVTENNCTDTSACESIVGLSVDKNSLDVVKVYPNPTTGMVQLNMGSVNETYSYTVLSADGKLIASEKNINNEIIMLNLSNNANGIYMVTLQTLNNTKKIRIVKN